MNRHNQRRGPLRLATRISKPILLPLRANGMCSEWRQPDPARQALSQLKVWFKSAIRNQLDFTIELPAERTLAFRGRYVALVPKAGKRRGNMSLEHDLLFSSIIMDGSCATAHPDLIQKSSRSRWRRYSGLTAAGDQAVRSWRVGDTDAQRRNCTGKASGLSRIHRHNLESFWRR
jgi:hypothetical protein